jgi:hypothetical protein
VPGLIVSPWAKRGFVSSTLYEHSSVPAFIEFLHGLEPLTVRDANANFFLDTFDIDRLDRNDPRPFTPLPVLELDTEVPEECTHFPSSGGLFEVQDIAAYADAGLLPRDLDRRRDAPETLQAINRELMRLRAGRWRKR